MLERRGIISGYEGSKPRQVLVSEADLPAVHRGARRARARRRAAPRPTSPRRPLPFGVEMADIGAMLREARMREHLDIAEFEARTKIRAKYLRALEDEEWALLPGLHLHEGVPAHLRRHAGARRADARRRVQAPVPRPLGDRARAAAPPARRDARRARERPRERGGERRADARARAAAARGGGRPARVLLIALLVVLVAAAVFVVRELRSKGKTHDRPRRTTTHDHHDAQHDAERRHRRRPQPATKRVGAAARCRRRRCTSA